MLDAIADFWKPAKKLPPKSKVNMDELQLGSAVGFGFVPQLTLSGRRLTVTAINTYQFADDVLTSFVLSQDKDAGASMIVAQADGEQYLALSRRISMTDRNKLFDAAELDAILEKPDITHFACKEGVADYKGWTVANYKREMQWMKGRIFKGDFRKISLGLAGSALEFSYLLLVSESNEHALEIEKYEDGRVEVYATVYRRVSDIGEISAPLAKENIRPEIRLESSNAKPASPAVSAPVLTSPLANGAAIPSKTEPKLELAKLERVKQEAPPHHEHPKAEPVKEAVAVSDVKDEVKSEPIHLPEFAPENVAKKLEDIVPKPDLVVSQAAPVIPLADHALTIKSSDQPFITKEIKAVNKDAMNQFVNESIDCDLQVANKIIDEAIRNEMRINDVVRRVIGLPVSQQESVQIPVTLTDQDYSLLAIRYGIAATDREAIKRRITEDLGDFSGANKQKKAA